MADDARKHRGGVEVYMIPTDTTAVPVVYMNTSSTFSQHASRVLQLAVGIDCKVDSLFVQYADRQILRECAKHGWGESEIFIGRCTERGLTHILGVGLNGKRSVMLALAIAIVFYVDPKRFDLLYAELQEQSAMGMFDNIMETAWQGIRALRKERRSQNELREGTECEGECEEDNHGIGIDLICNGAVPVVSLTTSSVFTRCASWLLQTMTNTESRAVDVYSLVQDERILGECRHLGYDQSDLWIVQLRRYPFSTAVGMTGQRSATMALVVAMILSQSVNQKEVFQKVRKDDPFLEEPLRWLSRHINAKAHRATVRLVLRSRREDDHDQHGRRGAPEASFDSRGAQERSAWTGRPSSQGGGGGGWKRPASGGASSSRDGSRRPTRTRRKWSSEASRKDAHLQGEARAGEVYVW